MVRGGGRGESPLSPLRALSGVRVATAALAEGDSVKLQVSKPARRPSSVGPCAGAATHSGMLHLCRLRHSMAVIGGRGMLLPGGNTK
jgi:hypothetical protein